MYPHCCYLTILLRKSLVSSVVEVRLLLIPPSKVACGLLRFRLLELILPILLKDAHKHLSLSWSVTDSFHTLTGI